MEYTKGSAKGTEKELRVYLLSDLHFGSAAVDWDLWNKVKNSIRKHKENSRILILGDIIEGVTKQSKGDLYEEKLNPREQVQLAADELYEFRDIIDLVIIGNHDIRIKDASSFDPMEILCDKLGISEKYKGYEALVGYSLNKNHYSIQCFHGAGGSSTHQTIVNKMKQIRKSNCDVVATGHWHQEVQEFFFEYDIDKYNHKVRKKKKWYICANTITGYALYAKRFGYKEKSPSQCYLKLSGKKNNWSIEPVWIRAED